MKDGLSTLGFDGIESVRVGKRIEVRLEAADDDAAAAEVQSMCERLLANQIIENFEFEVTAAAAAG